MDFNRKESDVVEEIKYLRDSIPGLCFHGSHQAVSTGNLIPGCEMCTRKAYMSFQLGFRCNAKCPFCFLDTYDADTPDEDEKYVRQTYLKEFHRRKNELEGVALTGGEPLLYLPELEACVTEMREAKPGLYFWVYTMASLPMTNTWVFSGVLASKKLGSTSRRRTTTRKRWGTLSEREGCSSTLL